MFNPKEDKEILKREIRKIINKEMGFSLKLLWSILRGSKIIAYYTFALIGVAFILYHYLMGQPYHCIYKTETTKDEIENTTIQETLLYGCYNDYWSCYGKLKECENQITNITQNYQNYCLTDIFEPTCKMLGYEKYSGSERDEVIYD